MRRKIGDQPQAKSEPKSLRFFFRQSHIRGLWILVNLRLCAVCKEKQVMRIPSGLVVRHKVWVSKKGGRVQMSMEEK